jgi:hypothetical protein
MIVSLNEKWPWWDTFKKRMPLEGGIILEAHDCWNLFVFYPTPTPEEIDNIRNSPIKISLFQPAADPSIFFCIKFGQLAWQDVPYDIRLTQKAFNITPIHNVPVGQGLTLLITLIDTNSGIVKVLRMLAMPHQTSVQFNTMLRNQLESNWHHDKTIDYYYNKYTSQHIAETGNLVDALTKKISENNNLQWHISLN